jgi:murein DD-endopeptidase MepM/ murein hydrolase activator NlpD
MPFLNRDYKSPDQKNNRRLRPLFLVILSLVALTIFILTFIDTSESPVDALNTAPVETESNDTEKDDSGTRIRKSLTLPDHTSGKEAILEPIQDTHAILTAKTPDSENWITHKVKSGDTLSSIFSKLEIHSQLNPILRTDTARSQLKAIHPGQTIKALKEDGQLARLIFEPNANEYLEVIKQEDSYSAQLVNRPIERRVNRASAIINDSLFLAGRRSGLSDSLIMELAGIFGWDIDFALDIREGDNFTLIFEELYRDDEKIGDGAIIAAEFTNQGRTYRAIRYEPPQGTASYYSPEGRSMRKAFLRTPVNFTRISSRFNLKRKHPVLNRIRAHKGVDYAAPKGTPVRAAGDGKIIFKGRKGGYGRTIIVQHGTRYNTLYAHLNSYHKKMRNGTRVKQGQVIGFVGMSGLATGPHLHYEFRVNGVHRNPLTVKLPAAEPLPKQYMTDFNQYSAPLLSQLDLYRRTTIAEAGTPGSS